jgi:hypothetical protein
MVTSQCLLARVAASEQKVYLYIAFGEQQFKMLGYAAKLRSGLQRSFRTAIEDMKQSQKERSRHPTQRQQPPGARQTEPAPPPAYVMSEGAEDHPVFCSHQSQLSCIGCDLGSGCQRIRGQVANGYPG